jgi:hypothetical protein
VKKNCAEIKNIAMSGVNHLNATYAYVAGLMETNPHTWTVWILVFKDIQCMHFLIRIMRPKATL